MSVHSPSKLKKVMSGKKLTTKTKEVIELEAILADLQDSPLKLSSPVKYSPSHVRSSPRTKSAQKITSPVAFKRNLEKDYPSPGKGVKRIDFQSPSKKVPSFGVGSPHGNSIVSPRKLSKEIGVSNHGDLQNITSPAIVKLEAIDSNRGNLTPTKTITLSNGKHVNGVHASSSHKLSVTKRNSNLENKSLASQKSGSRDDLLETGLIKMPKSLKELNLSKLDSLPSLNIGLKSDAKDFKIKTPTTVKPDCNEKLDENDIAAMLEDSDDDKEDNEYPGVKGASKNSKNEICNKPISSPASDIQRVVGSSRRKTNWKLEKYRMGYDDEDIIFIKDYGGTPDKSASSPSTKKMNSPKPASSSKQQKQTGNQNRSRKNGESDGDDLKIVKEPKSHSKTYLSSKKKGVSTSKKDSETKKKDAPAPTDSSKKSKARRSLLQEATYSIEDSCQSPLKLKLKRKASTVTSSYCNDSEDDDEPRRLKLKRKAATAVSSYCNNSDDDEPRKLKVKRKAATVVSSYCNESKDDESDDDESLRTKLRKTVASASKTNDKTPSKSIDSKKDNSTPTKEDIKTKSLKRKSCRSTVTGEDDGSDEEPFIMKSKRAKTDLISETEPREKSLRSRESIKLPKWRLMDAMNGICRLKSPTRSPSASVQPPNSDFNTPKKPTTFQCHSPRFDQLVSSVQKKFGKGEGSPANGTEEIGKEQDTNQKTPNKNGLSKSVLSPRKCTPPTVVPFELNTRPSRAKILESDKIDNDSTKKRSNKENLLRPSTEQSVTNDSTRSTSKKSLQRNVNLPLKVTAVKSEQIPSEGVKSPKNATEVVGSSLDDARIQLMVSAVPKSLPCRDKEFNNIYSFLGRKIEDFAGGCMYISGVPGTGKTATVHAVVRKLQEDVENGDLSAFDFVEINSLRLTEPRQAYTRILQSLTGTKLPSEQALRMLDNKFSGRGRKSTVLLVDELDYLCNRRQDVIYSILEWPMRQGSGVVVLTIANTMDLPERTLKGKVTSRMGLTRLTFQPYTHHQLQEIVMNRLIGNDSFHPDAVQLVARKVAAVSGDARRALDICRRATELVSPAKGDNAASKTVTIQHVEKAVSQISSGRRILAIKACSTMAQLALRALRDETLRTGIDESNVAHMYKHLLNICALEGVEKPTFGEIQRICTNLESLGLIIAEKGRPDLMRKLSLNVSSDDIHYALNC
ncbi:origin recognition complex subunit 1 [Nilaparvata lugens]|uniref:origin recognition complex subunit 1 n=1 Tax=Nilaparvata lugens TaxID=108931 RepID=UPI00193C9D12|nr:origin recognition complex subunit 1 [Nilaparvata lugens]